MLDGELDDDLQKALALSMQVRPHMQVLSCAVYVLTAAVTLSCSAACLAAVPSTGADLREAATLALRVSCFCSCLRIWIKHLLLVRLTGYNLRDKLAGRCQSFVVESG
jgi:hypothetical protein